MSTQSCLKEEEKQPQGKVPPGPKNELVPAPGDALGPGHRDRGAWVPIVWSTMSPSGGGALGCGTAGACSWDMAVAGAISVAAEDPGRPPGPVRRKAGVLSSRAARVPTQS